MNEQEIKEFIKNNLLTKHEALEQFNITSAAFDNYVRRSKFEPFIKKGPRINLYLKREIEQSLKSINNSKWNISNDTEDEIRTYNFFKKSLSFDEFIKDIKTYLSFNFADPKGEHLNIVKEAIRKNGFDNPEAFLNKYIWDRKGD